MIIRQQPIISESALYVFKSKFHALLCIHACELQNSDL